MRFSVITSVYNQKEQLLVYLEAMKKQTYKDFEIIIADDGSSDGTQEMLLENYVDKVLINNPLKCVSQLDEGYRLVEILNKAAAAAEGDYLVFIMGDSYPKADFLEQLHGFVADDRLVTGLRNQVNKEQEIVGTDWRVERVMFDIDRDEVQIMTPRPWQLMTLNSMCMPRAAFEKMGGIYPEYKGYGQMDWDMAAWAHFHGMKLFWIPKAVIYHFQHQEKDDTPANIEIFKKRLATFEAPELDKQERIQQKMDTINDPARAEAKKQAILKKREETEHVLEQGADEE